MTQGMSDDELDAFFEWAITSDFDLGPVDPNDFPLTPEFVPIYAGNNSYGTRECGQCPHWETAPGSPRDTEEEWGYHWDTMHGGNQP